MNSPLRSLASWQRKVNNKKLENRAYSSIPKHRSKVLTTGFCGDWKNVVKRPMHLFWTVHFFPPILFFWEFFCKKLPGGFVSQFSSQAQHALIAPRPSNSGVV